MKQILVVDDDPSFGRVLHHFLRKKGWQPELHPSLSSGRKALQEVAFDAVVLDLRLGNESGFDLLREIQSDSDSPLPVIIITAENTPDNAIEAMGQGAVEYLVKPFDLEDLEQALVRALAPSGQEDPVDAEVPVSDKTLVGRSAAMRDVYKRIGLYSRHAGTVLIQGESGVGKELVARAIHNASTRSRQPFVPINMSAIPETLLESELFGYEKGAFTGADRAQPGKFRLANGGTIFLDEIGDMPMAVQAKLLRVLQEREVSPIGSAQSCPINVRVISATQVDLAEAVASDRFRQDLYFRLNVLPIDIPPLRDRREDIPELAGIFLARNTQGRKRFSDEVIRHLSEMTWAGNVRELQNVVERVSLLSQGSTIGMDELRMFAKTGLSNPSSPVSLEQQLHQIYLPLIEDLLAANETGILARLLEPLERIVFERTLTACHGNQIKVAQILGLNRNTVRKRISQLGIDLADIKNRVRHGHGTS